MGRLYLLGFRTARRCWPLWGLLFVTSCIAAVGFAGASWLWLSYALDASLATRTLLVDLDLNIFVDLLAHERTSLTMLLAAGAMLVGALWFVGVWLNAIVIASLADEVPLPAAARRAVDLYWRFFRMALCALVADAAIVVAATTAGWYLVSSMEDPTDLAVYVVGVACAGAAAGLVLIVTTAHDHARIHSAATDAGAGEALRWALHFVTRGDRRALPLAGVLAATGGLAWLVYQAAGTLLSTAWVPGLVLSLVWGQGLLLFRMFLRVWRFAAQLELQNRSEAA